MNLSDLQFQILIDKAIIRAFQKNPAVIFCTLHYCLSLLFPTSSFYLGNISFWIIIKKVLFLKISGIIFAHVECFCQHPNISRQKYSLVGLYCIKARFDSFWIGDCGHCRKVNSLLAKSGLYGKWNILELKICEMRKYICYYFNRN